MKILFLPLLLLTACNQEPSTAQRSIIAPPKFLIVPEGKTVGSRINPPQGYSRLTVKVDSYAAFLRNLALKPNGTPVHYFDGRVKPNDGIYSAVLDLDVGPKDLQQCADAVVRIRAEYLFAVGKSFEIKFHFTNGFLADFPRWSEGYRISVNGNKCAWVKKASPKNDHAALREYLDFVYNYAGTLSLSRELKSIDFLEMQSGDVLIVGGSPGHAVTIMDMAVNKAGKKVYLLSQSYMPAQDIQILQNPTNKSISPWYELNESNGTVVTPQWEFTTSQLKRFQ